MTTVKTNKKTSRSKYPWSAWVKESSPNKPATIRFGKDVPESKKPMTLVTQLHQWGRVFKRWVYTSVAHDKSHLKVYGVPIVEGKERPESIFPSPKKGTHHTASSGKKMAKKKAAKKESAPKKSAKKTSKKKAA